MSKEPGWIPGLKEVSKEEDQNRIITSEHLTASWQSAPPLTSPHRDLWLLFLASPLVRNCKCINKRQHQSLQNAAKCHGPLNGNKHFT